MLRANKYAKLTVRACRDMVASARHYPAYEQTDAEGKLIAKIILYNDPAPNSCFDLRVGQEGPYTEKTGIRRVR